MSKIINSKKLADYTDQQVTIIESYWTDSDTRKLIGKKVKLLSKNHSMNFVTVGLDRLVFNLHLTEILELEKFISHSFTNYSIS